MHSLITDFNGEVLFTGEITRADNFKPEYVNAPDDIFIFLYTSGSTDVPRGVKLTHKNLVCFTNRDKKFYGLTEKIASELMRVFGFDAKMVDTYPALICGATVCIVPEQPDLIAMNNYYEKNHVIHAFMTTQVVRQFAKGIEITA